MLSMHCMTFAGDGLKISIGPKIGYQTTSLSYEQAQIKTDFSNHFTAGLFCRLAYKKLYFQPEIFYFKTSNTFAGVSGDNGTTSIIPDTDATVTLNTMNLHAPMMIGLNVIDLDLLVLRAHIGPTANFVLNSRTSTEYILGGVNGGRHGKTDASDIETNAVSWGLQCGFGLDLLRRITFDINYNIGLSDVISNYSDSALAEMINHVHIDDITQNMFIVTVGFKIF